MSVIINPIITNAGLNVFTPMATGIEFTFTHVAVGTGTSAVNANATALQNEIARFTIAGGGVIAGGKAVSINALVTNHANANPQDYNISEIGFYGLDANNNTILFAIHRQNTTIVRKVAGADIALPFVLGLSALPVENMTVTIDTNTSGALALLGQHVAANHPHTQYKRILDNTERLKIANATANDEAVSLSQMNSAISSGIGGIPPVDLSGKADLAGSSTQTFSVATATAAAHAVRKEQLDAVANAAITNEQIVKLVYPVGSLIEFQDGTNPNTLWPYTTWTVYGEGRVTVAQGGDFNFLTAVGGGKDFTLTMSHIPEHDHNRNPDANSENAHCSIGSGAAGDYIGTNGYIHTYTKTGKAGQATPTPIPTMPPYIVVKRWVRTA